MSFRETKELVEEGDVVILYVGPTNMHSLEVTPKILNKKGQLVDNVFQTTYGALKVLSLIGQRYGSKVELSRGWAYVLQPTPELWTVTLPHRTQIIYTPDISFIIFSMDLQPGSVVVETGTGSGSLSHSLIRAVRPSGHLHTFDFHEQRVSLAQGEFQKHGLADFVTVKHRDVCLDGFGDELRGKVDAAFLDLPHPWLVIQYVSDVLKEKGGKLCSFSPCIEQVQRTCEKLSSSGYVDIETYECLQRELNVHYKNIPVLDLECLKVQHTGETKEKEGDNNRTQRKLLTVSRSHNVAGHTGFITIATLPPAFARQARKD